MSKHFREESSFREKNIFYKNNVLQKQINCHFFKVKLGLNLTMLPLKINMTAILMIKSTFREGMI